MRRKFCISFKIFSVLSEQYLNVYNELSLTLLLLSFMAFNVIFGNASCSYCIEADMSHTDSSH